MSLSELLVSSTPIAEWKNIYVNSLTANNLNFENVNVENLSATNLSATNGLISNCTASTLISNNATVVTSLTMSNEAASSAPYFDAQKRLSSSVLTNGQLMIGSSGNPPFANTITGTANRVSVTNGSGSITLSAPQDLAPASDVTFNTANLTNQSYLILSNTTLQNIVSGVSTPAVFDTNNVLGSNISYNSGTGLITVNAAGKYLATFCASFAAGLAVGVRSLYLNVGGGGISVGARTNSQSEANATNAIYLTGSEILVLNAGDTIQLILFQNSGANLNVNTSGYMTVYQLP